MAHRRSTFGSGAGTSLLTVRVGDIPETERFPAEQRFEVVLRLPSAVLLEALVMKTKSSVKGAEVVGLLGARERADEPSEPMPFRKQSEFGDATVASMVCRKRFAVSGVAAALRVVIRGYVGKDRKKKKKKKRGRGRKRRTGGRLTLDGAQSDDSTESEGASDCSDDDDDEEEEESDGNNGSDDGLGMPRLRRFNTEPVMSGKGRRRFPALIIPSSSADFDGEMGDEVIFTLHGFRLDQQPDPGAVLPLLNLNLKLQAAAVAAASSVPERSRPASADASPARSPRLDTPLLCDSEPAAGLEVARALADAMCGLALMQGRSQNQAREHFARAARGMEALGLWGRAAGMHVMVAETHRDEADHGRVAALAEVARCHGRGEGLDEAAAAAASVSGLRARADTQINCIALRAALVPALCAQLRRLSADKDGTAPFAGRKMLQRGVLRQFEFVLDQVGEALGAQLPGTLAALLDTFPAALSPQEEAERLGQAWVPPRDSGRRRRGGGGGGARVAARSKSDGATAEAGPAIMDWDSPSPRVPRGRGGVSVGEYYTRLVGHVASLVPLWRGEGPAVAEMLGVLVTHAARVFPDAALRRALSTSYVAHAVRSASAAAAAAAAAATPAEPAATPAAAAAADFESYNMMQQMMRQNQWADDGGGVIRPSGSQSSFGSAGSGGGAGRHRRAHSAAPSLSSLSGRGGGGGGGDDDDDDDECTWYAESSQGLTALRLHTVRLLAVACAVSGGDALSVYLSSAKSAGVDALLDVAAAAVGNDKMAVRRAGGVLWAVLGDVLPSALDTGGMCGLAGWCHRVLKAMISREAEAAKAAEEEERRAAERDKARLAARPVEDVVIATDKVDENGVPQQPGGGGGSGGGSGGGGEESEAGRAFGGGRGGSSSRRRAFPGADPADAGPELPSLDERPGSAAASWMAAVMDLFRRAAHGYLWDGPRVPAGGDAAHGESLKRHGRQCQTAVGKVATLLSAAVQKRSERERSVTFPVYPMMWECLDLCYDLRAFHSAGASPNAAADPAAGPFARAEAEAVLRGSVDINAVVATVLRAAHAKCATSSPSPMLLHVLCSVVRYARVPLPAAGAGASGRSAYTYSRSRRVSRPQMQAKLLEFFASFVQWVPHSVSDHTFHLLRLLLHTLQHSLAEHVAFPPALARGEARSGPFVGLLIDCMLSRYTARTMACTRARRLLVEVLASTCEATPEDDAAFPFRSAYMGTVVDTCLVGLAAAAKDADAGAAAAGDEPSFRRRFRERCEADRLEDDMERLDLLLDCVEHVQAALRRSFSDAGAGPAAPGGAGLVMPRDGDAAGVPVTEGRAEAMHSAYALLAAVLPRAAAVGEALTRLAAHPSTRARETALRLVHTLCSVYGHVLYSLPTGGDAAGSGHFVLCAPGFVRPLLECSGAFHAAVFSVLSSVLAGPHAGAAAPCPHTHFEGVRALHGFVRFSRLRLTHLVRDGDVERDKVWRRVGALWPLAAALLRSPWASVRRLSAWSTTVWAGWVGRAWMHECTPEGREVAAVPRDESALSIVSSSSSSSRSAAQGPPSFLARWFGGAHSAAAEADKKEGREEHESVLGEVAREGVLESARDLLRSSCADERAAGLRLLGAYACVPASQDSADRAHLLKSWDGPGERTAGGWFEARGGEADAPGGLPRVGALAAAHVCDVSAQLRELGALKCAARLTADSDPGVRGCAKALLLWLHHAREELARHADKGPADARHAQQVRALHASTVSAPRLHNPYTRPPAPRLAAAPPSFGGGAMRASSTVTLTDLLSGAFALPAGDGDGGTGAGNSSGDGGGAGDRLWLPYARHDNDPLADLAPPVPPTDVGSFAADAGVGARAARRTASYSSAASSELSGGGGGGVAGSPPPPPPSRGAHAVRVMGRPQPEECREPRGDDSGRLEVSPPVVYARLAEACRPLVEWTCASASADGDIDGVVDGYCECLDSCFARALAQHLHRTAADLAAERDRFEADEWAGGGTSGEAAVAAVAAAAAIAEYEELGVVEVPDSSPAEEEPPQPKGGVRPPTPQVVSSRGKPKRPQSASKRGRSFKPLGRVSPLPELPEVGEEDAALERPAMARSRTAPERPLSTRHSPAFVGFSFGAAKEGEEEEKEEGEEVVEEEVAEEEEEAAVEEAVDDDLVVFDMEEGG